MSDVDLYIMKFGPEVRQRLMKIRRIALDVFERMDERIYYGIPTLSIDGTHIMCYAAYKGYISIIIGYDWVDFLKNQYPQFRYTRATIQFQHKDPFPDETVQVICELLKQGLFGCINHNSPTS